jgi:4-amino-4-deoxy-L-arabinose transferase-like glycosyltransferase
VTQTSNELPESQPLSTTARLLWLVLIVATLYLCYFHNLGALGLVGPDEPRYAWIARDMHETGDYITPRLYGKPWFEKPPLYYWSAALSFKFFGVSETSARLPSAISALLATLALAWLALRLYGAETARWLLLLLPTTIGMIGFSHAAATDMPFAAMLTIAMGFATKLLNLIPSPAQQSVNSAAAQVPLRSFTSFTSSTSFTSFYFGFFLGLAVLAKGPAAIILSGGAVLLWALFTNRWRDAFRCLHPVAIASFCLTALPWYILCVRRNPDFFRIFIIEHNFNRFLTPQFQHIQPIWFYVPIFIIAVFPWIFIHSHAKLVFLSNWLHHSTESQSQALLLAWAGFTFLFFTLAKSKLPGYIMPAIPPMALLSAHASTLIAKNPGHSPRWPLLGTGFALIIFGAALLRLPHKISAFLCGSPTCGTTPIWALALCGGITVGTLAVGRRLRIGMFAAVITTLLMVAAAEKFLPDVDASISARNATRTVRNVWPDFSSEKAATWQLNRSFAYQLSYYEHQEIPEWTPGEFRPLWLFVPKIKEDEAANLKYHCEKIGADPAVIPCRDSLSLGGLNGGNAGDNRAGRQPR